ncbi:MAG: hypothetical protein QOC57_384 [Ilumatobacteraceae bacterium]
MFTPLRGLRIGRRAIVLGFVLAGATATAVGAASGNPIWQGALRPFPATTDTPTTTAAPQPPATEPATTEPATTQPATTLPATTQPAPTEPAALPPAADQPVADEPVVAEPAAEQPPAAPPAADEPAPTAPATTETPAPAPPAAPAPKTNDNVVPATLSLSCSLVTDSAAGPVACSWSGASPDGFASFVLLRGDPDGKGRVPYRSSDANASSFVDTTASAGKHSYVVVALDAADHPLAHSNMVLVQIATT